MHARYERALNERVLPSLLPGGAFSFLIPDRPVDDPCAVDIQVRERNKLVFYHGRDRLLTVQFKAGNDGVEARAHAASVYGTASGCEELFRALMKQWSRGETDAFRTAFRAYIPAAIAAADARDDQDQQEGCWMDRLCARYGRQWTQEDEWLIVDRDCVIGFNNTDEQTRYYERMRRGYQAIKDGLQHATPGIWGASDGKPFGGELDLLAINRIGDLVTIALKHGGTASDTCWSPLEVGMHRDAFESILSSIREDLQDLVRQKIALGLLPAAARGLLDASTLRRVKPVVLISEPGEWSASRRKMEQVIAEMKRSTLPQPELPLRIGMIHVGSTGLELTFADALRPS